jgi:hypothetical protein
MSQLEELSKLSFLDCFLIPYMPAVNFVRVQRQLRS